MKKLILIIMVVFIAGLFTYCGDDTTKADSGSVKAAAVDKGTDKAVGGSIKDQQKKVKMLRSKYRKLPKGSKERSEAFKEYKKEKRKLDAMKAGTKMGKEKAKKEVKK